MVPSVKVESSIALFPWCAQGLASMDYVHRRVPKIRARLSLFHKTPIAANRFLFYNLVGKIFYWRIK